MRIVISGGGIGGLTLAQALRDRAHITVVERDRDATSTGGYRLALNGAATAVLERHLDPALLSDIRDVSDGADRFRQFTIAASSLRPLVIAPEDASEDRLLAQRRALRLLLTRGIEDRIRWSTSVTAVEAHPHDARVHLSDGTTLTGDLVVGAEGAVSPVVRAATPGPTSADLHLTGIAGSTPRRAGDVIPHYLRHGPALAFGADGVGVFLSLTWAGSARVPPDLTAAVGDPSIVWGLIAPTRRLPPTARAAPVDLVHAAVDVTRDWHPWLGSVMRRSDLDRVAAFPFRAADPTSDLTPWSPGPLTALGDAVHAMPPTGGRAAATAIRDAGCLADQLLAHLDGRLTLDEALRGYHAKLRDWAIPALRESLGPVRVIRALGRPGATLLSRPLLAAASAVLSPLGRSHDGRVPP